MYRIRRARYLQALILAPNFFSVKLILLLTFLTVVLVGSDVTPDKVFVTIAIYQAIRVPITVFIPFAVQNIAEMRISFDRLQVRGDLDLTSCPLLYPSCSARLV